MSNRILRPGLSRRNLLKMAGLGSAGAALAACTPAATQAPTAAPDEPTTAGEPTAVPPTEGEASTEQVTIRFMGWGNPNEQQIFQTLIDKYQANNPNVKVDYLNVPPAEFLQKLTTMVAGGDVPDVFYMADGWFGNWVSQGVLLPIEEYIDAAELANIWPRALARYRWDGEVVGRGQLYCLPKDLGPWVMVYNKDLYDEAGVAYPPTDGSYTWDQAIEDWKKIRALRPEVFGMGGFTVEAAVWSNGGDFLNAERTAVTIDDPKFYEAIQWIADLALVHGVAPTPEQQASMGTYDMWINGLLGANVMGPWDQPAFWELPFNWDIAPFPASPATGRPASWTGSMGFAVSAGTAHPREAVELQRYFSVDEDGQRTTYQLGQAVPNRMDMAKGEFLTFDKPPANRQVFLDNIEDWGRPTPSTYVSDNRWLDTIWQELGPVWNGEKTAEAWAKEWAPQCTELLNSVDQIKSVVALES